MSVTRLPVRRYFSAPRLERRRAEFVLLIALAVLLELAAGVGLAYVAGFPGSWAALGFEWVWLAALAFLLTLRTMGEQRISGAQ